MNDKKRKSGVVKVSCPMENGRPEFYTPDTIFNRKHFMLVPLAEYLALKKEKKSLEEANARLRRLVSFAICKLEERSGWSAMTEKLFKGSERVLIARLQPKRKTKEGMKV